LISFTLLIVMAHAILISPIGFRDPDQIYRIVRKKARVQGAMGSIVEWQSLKMQEYRFRLLAGITRFWGLFGVRRPLRYEPPPVTAGDYDEAVHLDLHTAPSLLVPYMSHPPEETGAHPTDPDSPPPEPKE